MCLVTRSVFAVPTCRLSVLSVSMAMNCSHTTALCLVQLDSFVPATEGQSVTSLDLNFGLYRAEWSACWTFDPAVGVPVPLAAGGRVAIMGQLLFAP